MSSPPPREPQQERTPDRSTHPPVGLRVGRDRAEPDEVIVAPSAVIADHPTTDAGAGPGAGRGAAPSARLSAGIRPGQLGLGRFAPGPLLAALVRSAPLTVLALIGLSAVLRLPGLMDRGIFDADQGRDMLVIYNLVEHGQLPLLGPETISIANSHLHHGAFYWYLFAPAAWLGGGDPTGVLLETALIGIAAVVATWWAARLMGGPVVGAVAGLLLAVSPAAVEQSIFLWNPNPIPLFAALALGGAWKAHLTGGARWYALAIGAAVAVYQLHLLGAAFVVGIGFLVAYDLVRALRIDRSRLPGLTRGIAVGIAITVVLFLPLIANELNTGFDESRKLLAFLQHGGSVPTTGGLDPVEAIIFIVIRIIGWPFVGLVLDVPLAAVIAVIAWIALVLWWLVASRGEDHLLMAWLLGIVAFSTVALDIMAPWLRFVVIGFPTDHYHAFLNPVEIIAISLAGVAFANGAGAIRRNAPRSRSGDTAARLLISIALVGELVVAGARQPAPSDVGTWPEARSIGAQIVRLAGGAPIAVVGLPDFKSPDSIGFPIVDVGGNVVADPSQARWLVVNCDNRFKDTALNAPCGGGAEDEDAAFLLEPEGLRPQLVTRFEESEALWISVYGIGPTQP